MRREDRYFKNLMRRIHMELQYKIDKAQGKIEWLYWMLPLMGIAMIISSFYSSIAGSLPFYGGFLILIWSILNAQIYRVRINNLRNGYFAVLSTGEKIKPDLKKVILYTSFCLLPLHLMFIFSIALAMVIKELLGWVILGVPFTFISFFAMWSFSSTWKDMNIKITFFWVMQILIFVMVNATTILFFSDLNM